MAKVDGKIVVKETGAGVPDLIVSVYETAGEAPALAGRAGSDFWAKIQNGRLGAVATDGEGRFKLEWGSPAPDAAVTPAATAGALASRAASRTAPARAAAPGNLIVVVTAPEEDGAASPKVLYASSARGKNGGQEAFIIRLGADQLKKSGIAAPPAPGADPRSAAGVLASLEAADALKEELRPRTEALSKKRLERRTATTDAFRKDVRPSLEASLSRVPDDVRASNAYVPADGDVRAANLLKIKENIREVVNQPTRRAPVRGVAFLTEEQWNRLQSFDDGTGTLKNVPASAAVDDDGGTVGDLLAGRLGGAGTGAPAELQRRDPLEDLCRPESHDRSCALDHLGLEGGTPHETEEETPPATPPVTGENVVPVTEGDVGKFVARILNPVTPPEGPVVFGQGGRATQQDIEDSVGAFQLRPGPADATAFHDFHQLQIAFEPVWQELIDQGLLGLAEDAYHQVVELGGAAPAPAAGGPKNYYVHFVDAVNLTFMAQEQNPPPNVLKAFEVTKQQWNVLPADARAELIRLGDAIDKRSLNLQVQVLGQTVQATLSPEAVGHLREAGANLVRYADTLLAAKGTDRYAHLHGMLNQLVQRVKEPYAFTIYAADKKARSVNFGIVATYRQKLEPVAYQAGKLIKTIPLAPKESRKFVKKLTVKRSRAEKEVLNSLRSRKEESKVNSKAESEIIGRASVTTNFSMSSEESFDMEFSSGGHTVGFDRNAETVSEETKRSMHEALFTAAEEVKNERTTEVTTSFSEDMEAEESGEISNPNDELPVTFLFYELQRRYRVFEKIHRVTPVVLVAQEVPRPDEIDEDWVVAHDWILKRVLLDDSHGPAIAYLSTRLPGDEVALEEMRKNVEQQRRIAERLKDDMLALKEEAGKRYEALEIAMKRRIAAAGSGGGGGLLGFVTDTLVDVEEALLGGGGDSAEKARLREEAMKDLYEKAARDEKESRSKLEREVTALNAQTEAYTKALSEHMNRKAQVLRLLVHLKMYILYYMQAIWSHEPPDQRYFRLHKVKVPKFQATASSFTMAKKLDWLGDVPHAGMIPVSFTPDVQVAPEFDTVDLANAADLDRLLGYKGNYMIFPLKQTNALTDLMIAPYVDAAFGAHDPDEAGNWTLEEFSKYVCCLHDKLPSEKWEALKPRLKEQYKRLLMKPLRSGEEIIVPTDSLFIEALPGSRPILEDFKLVHRAVDVKKAQAEARRLELENIRMAARLVTGEHEDPDIERKIVIEGKSTGITIPADEN